jgi:hypothetical protein
MRDPLRSAGTVVLDEMMAHTSPVAWEHIGVGPEANDCVVVSDNEKDFAGIDIINPLRGGIGQFPFDGVDDAAIWPIRRRRCCINH